MGRPEEDFTDELEGEETPPDAGAPQLGDGDVGMAGEAPDDEDPYQMASSDSDVTGLAEDAGEGASYGFDAARDTVRFDRPVDAQDDLADSVARRADESSKYAVGPEVLDAEPAAFAEVAGSVDPDAELGLAPSAGGYADAAEDDPNLASSVDDQAGYAADDQAGYAADDQAGYAADDQDGHTADDQAVSEQAQAYLDEEPPAPPRSTAPAPTPGDEGDVKPGQIRRSALDEMFARAAELKRKKPS